MTREDMLKSMFATSGLGLEIGPSYNPLLPRSGGYNVEVLDHATQAELMAKYRNDRNVDSSRIEPVDYVWNGGSLADTIGGKGRYDFVVASHVIEHTPDIIAFLRDCEDLLRPDGVLTLAVPDKRYCFDAMRPVSTTGAALQAFHERRTRHLPGTVFDHVSSYATRGGHAGWHANEIGSFSLFNTVNQARAHFDQASAVAIYIDAHAWCFTPSSFRLMIRDLNEMGLLQLKEQAFRTTEWFEFFVVLSRQGQGCGIGRLELLETTAMELAQSARSR